MIFLFRSDDCRSFTMKKMKFNIFIKDKHGKYPFIIGEEKLVCGKKIIESID